MLDAELVREEFGFLGDRIHLNCCSVGVPPARVQEACKGFYDHYFNLVYGKSSGYGPHRSEVREKAARLMGARPHEIAFASSTTDGMCILAAGYPLGPGDNVVLCDLEIPTAMYAWINASKNRGFELRIVKTVDGRVEPWQLFERADVNTKIIHLSATQYGTGFFADLKEIGRECRSRGIVFSVDAIQALGRRVIDVEEMCIDYLSCGGFKALGAGFGIALVYCSDRIVSRINPAYAGECSVAESIGAPEVFGAEPVLPLYDDARRLEHGSHNTIGIVLLGAALDVLLDLGVEEIERHVLALEDQLRRGIAGTKLQFVGPYKPANRSGNVVAYYPREIHEQVKEIFDRERIVLTLRPGYIRLAFHCYNTPQQVETVIRAFRDISELIS
jgi:cysteine desulfurase/selenocysteine lyase